MWAGAIAAAARVEFSYSRVRVMSRPDGNVAANITFTVGSVEHVVEHVYPTLAHAARDRDRWYAAYRRRALYELLLRLCAEPSNASPFVVRGCVARSSSVHV